MWCWMSEVGGEIWCEVIEEVDRSMLRSVHDVWCDVGWVKLVERFDAKWSKRWTEQSWSLVRSVHVWCDVGWVKLVERFDAKWSKRWTEQWWGVFMCEGVLMCDVMLDEWSWWRDLMRSDRRGGQNSLVGQNSYKECSCGEECFDVWCDVGWVKLVERFDAKWSKRWTEVCYVCNCDASS